MLAMACAGSHTRAAALACEISGIHVGLRSLDGALTVLERRLRPVLGSGSSGLGESGGVMRRDNAGTLPFEEREGGGAGEVWFLPWLERLRRSAWAVFASDMFS